MKQLNTRLAEVWGVKCQSSEDAARKAAAFGEAFSASSGIPVAVQNSGSTATPVLVEGYGQRFTYHGVECPLQDGRVGSMVFAVNGGEEAYVVYKRRFETDIEDLPALQGLVQRIVDVAERRGLVACFSVQNDDHHPKKVGASLSLRAEYGASGFHVARLFGAVDRTISTYLE